MVKRVIIGTEQERIARLVGMVKQARIDAQQGTTTPAGNKVLEDDEDFYWARTDGTAHSMREVDENLDAAEARIDEATASLEDTQVRLEDATAEAEAAQARLDSIEETELPAVRAELEAAATKAAEDLAALDGQLGAAKQDLADAKVDLGILETDLANEAAARKQLAQDTQGTLDELDTRLEDFALDSSLGPIRQALTDAQDAVDAAQATATEANTAANAASQAALEAAGIAASKGRVIVSETEPMGDDRQPANIWIKPVADDPDTDVEEKAVTYVYITESDEWVPTTSSELAQAAQNALDAREAAQQAQQRADTAIANAATAQAAAEAAQQTADTATIDAREAHNAAVVAQERVDAAIESGDSLIINGSFESGALGWPAYLGDNTHSRAGIIEDPGARTGTHTLRLTPVDANTYPESEPLLAVTPGQVLNFRGWWKHLGGDGTQTRMLVRTHDAAKAYVGIQYPSGRTDVQSWPVGEWVLQEGDYVVEDGIRFLSFAPHATGASTSEYRVDDLQVIDVTDARAAQAAAQEAHELAESKLGEAEVDAKIKTSANGKNSITISPNAPSGVGTADGDVWWQRDGDSNIFGQWVWAAGAQDWIARQIDSEVIANLDVHKLQVTGSASMDEAVIDKLWVDGLAARAVTAGSVTVAPGNMISWTPRERYSPDISPHNAYTSNAEFIRWDFDDDMGGKVVTANMAAGGSTDFRFFMQLHPEVPVTDRVTEFGSNPFPVRGGTSYRLEFGLGRGGNYPDGTPQLKASLYVYDHNGTRMAIISAGPLQSESGSANPQFTSGRFGTTVELPEDAAYINIFLSASNSGYLYMFAPEFRPLVGAVQIEDGAISADKVNAESVAGAVGEFLELTTDQLTAGDATIGEAVINKVWADGIATKSLTSSRLVVAPGDLAPPEGRWAEGWGTGSGEPWRHWGLNRTSGIWAEGSDTGSKYIYSPMYLTAGQRYRFSVESNSSAVGVASYARLHKGDSEGNITDDTFVPSDPAGMSSGGYLLAASAGAVTGSSWTTWWSEFTALESGYAYFRVWPNSSAGADNTGGHQWFRNFSLRPMTGSTLIEDGAISTPKLNVTGSMSAAIVDAMSLSTKKLVVTGDAILNHATLIGQTVVDDINVQGKLIGSNGVFTGTVDFANINVTGSAILNKIGANSISADKVAGGSFSGKTFTGGAYYGGRFATSNEPFTDGGVQIDAQYGIRGWKPDSTWSYPTFFLSPNDGTMAMTANAYFTDPSTSNGLVISPETSYSSAALFFGKDKDVGADAAAVWRGTYTKGRDPLFLRGGNRSGVVAQNGLSVEGGSLEAVGGLIGGMAFNADTRDTTALNALTVMGSLSGEGNMSLDGNLYYYGSGTTSRAANLSRTPGGGRVNEVTSSRRYKKNITDWTPEAEAVLGMRPRTWQHDDPRNTDVDEDWHVGFIAEEIDDLGLEGLVVYSEDEEGNARPEALNYDRFVAAQQVVLQKHEAEISELRAENDDLRNRLDRLEALLTQENA